MSNVTTVEITPNKSLLPKLWNTGYTISEAIAELIDNSLDARIEWEVMEIRVQILDDSIAVSDKWTWMDFDWLKKAVTLAETAKKKGKLWHFGLWLKTACLWLWHRFKIRTTKKWDPKEYSVEFDETKWQKTEKRELDIIENDAVVDYHYTIVEISDLRTKNTIKDEKIIKWIQQRFSHFIGEVRIFVNWNEVEAVFPKIVESTKIEIDEPCCNWKWRLTWWVWLMEKSNQWDHYWLHCYKYKRLIVPFNKIWFKPHPTLARIFWEVNMDFVETTHDKREFERETPEYREAEAIIAKALINWRILADARTAQWKEKEKKEIKRETNNWNKETQKAVTKVAKKIQQSWWKVELPKQDTVKIWKSFESKENVITNKVSQAITKKETDWLKLYEIEFGWQKFSFTHSFEPLWAEQTRKMWTYDSDKKILRIISNSDFSAYFACNDLPFLATIHVAESLTELILKDTENENNLEEFMKIYISLLRTSSSLKEEFEEVESEDNLDENVENIYENDDKEDEENNLEDEQDSITDEYDDIAFDHPGYEKPEEWYNNSERNADWTHKVTWTIYWPDRYDINWWNPEWFHKETRTRYNPKWFDRYWFDKHRFKEDWVHENGTMYDDFWFDKDWIHKDTHTKRDLDGFNIDWENEYWFLRTWYHKNWTKYDDFWFDKDWIHKDTHTESNLNGETQYYCHKYLKH